jgi:hypothetical protein
MGVSEIGPYITSTHVDMYIYIYVCICIYIYNIYVVTLESQLCLQTTYDSCDDPPSIHKAGYQIGYIIGYINVIFLRGGRYPYFAQLVYD